MGFYKQPWFWALCVVAVAVAVVLGGRAVSTDRPSTHTIKYSITGTISRASVNYANPSGDHFDETKLEDQQLPWTKTVTVHTDPTKFGISASAGDKATGDLRCTLTIDGKYVETDSDEGSSPQVFCSASTAK